MRGRIPASPGTGVPEQSRAVGQRGAWAGTPTSTLLVCKVGLLQLLRWGRSQTVPFSCLPHVLPLGIELS